MHYLNMQKTLVGVMKIKILLFPAHRWKHHQGQNVEPEANNGLKVVGKTLLYPNSEDQKKIWVISSTITMNRYHKKRRKWPISLWFQCLCLKFEGSRVTESMDNYIFSESWDHTESKSNNLNRANLCFFRGPFGHYLNFGPCTPSY